MVVSYAKEIGRVINSYSQPSARLFFRFFATDSFLFIRLNPRNLRVIYARRIRKKDRQHTGGN
jgi:hypothetical protein